MKRSGILNPALAAGIARLGHQQIAMVVDAGMPLPAGAPIVDLSLILGVPRFTQVLDALLAELVIEGCTIASEAGNGVVHQWISDRHLAPDFVSHEQLKHMLPAASLVVRTGEATPFANIALRCGVAF